MPAHIYDYCQDNLPTSDASKESRGTYQNDTFYSINIGFYFQIIFDNKVVYNISVSECALPGKIYLCQPQICNPEIQ